MTTKTPQPFNGETDTTEALQRAADFWGEPIYTYTRSQAIADGLLVDVSDLAAEAGFRLPVALTRGVWTDCVKWSDEENRRQTYQDETGRLWDVIFLASLSARRGRGDCVTFKVHRVPRDCVAIRPTEVILQMRIGPGDSGEPVITVMHWMKIDGRDDALHGQAFIEVLLRRLTCFCGIILWSGFGMSGLARIAEKSGARLTHGMPAPMKTQFAQ